MCSTSSKPTASSKTLRRRRNKYRRKLMEMAKAKAKGCETQAQTRIAEEKLRITEEAKRSAEEKLQKRVENVGVLVNERKMLEPHVHHATEKDMENISLLLYKQRRQLLKFGAVLIVPPSTWSFPVIDLDESARLDLLEQRLPIHGFELCERLPHRRIPASPLHLSMMSVKDYLDYAQTSDKKFQLERVKPEFRTILQGSEKEKALRNEKRVIDVLKNGLYGCENVLIAQDNPFDKICSSLQAATKDINSSGLLSKFPKCIGVNTPILHLSTAGTYSPIHVEDNWLLSVAYMHYGAPRYLYVIPPSSAPILEEYVRRYVYIDSASKNSPIEKLIRQKTVTLNPEELLERTDINVVRAIHTPGTFLVTAPKSYHQVVCSGFSIAEGINYADPTWFVFGRESVLSYSICNDQALIPVEFLLFQEAWNMRKEIMQRNPTEETLDELEFSKRQRVLTDTRELLIAKNKAISFYKDLGSTIISLNARNEVRARLSLKHSLYDCDVGWRCFLCKAFNYFCVIGCGVCIEQSKTLTRVLCLEHDHEAIVLHSCSKRLHRGRETIILFPSLQSLEEAKNVLHESMEEGPARKKILRV